MLPRLINGAGKKKVDSGMKMLIEPIKDWLVANRFYKKTKKHYKFTGK